MSELLRDYSIFHAGIKPVAHPQLKCEVNAQTAVRYMRFLKPVSIDRLELPIGNPGRVRIVPSVPTHPAHLTISTLNKATNQWELIHEVDLPRIDKIEGKGVSPRMNHKEIEQFFLDLVNLPPHVIKLPDVITDHLRIECDREHPVWPCHAEFNGPPFCVPFWILHPLKAFGQQLGRPAFDSGEDYQPILKKGEIAPVAPKGMRIKVKPYMIEFESRKLSVGFSLVRPHLIHLGWDAFENGRATKNRLLTSRSFNRVDFNSLGGLSGPLLRTLGKDAKAQNFTGEVSASGNKISYTDLFCMDGVTIDAEFTVEPDSLILKLRQNAETDLPVIEAEAWRFLWDLDAGMTSNATMPALSPGRNGNIDFPAFIAGDSNGCLMCELLDGTEKTCRIQEESYRSFRARSTGISLTTVPWNNDALFVPAGRRQAEICFKVTSLEPENHFLKKLSPGLKQAWSSVFSVFRPELGGFSNNAASVNCHVNQGVVADMVLFSQKDRNGFKPLELARFTIERAILGGGGYGFHRSLYLDSDPILISGAGRIFQMENDVKWLKKIEPGIIEACARMLELFDDTGLAVSKTLSGNSGTHHWSTNAMDVISFGHIDAYSNAWIYRALRNATTMLDALEEKKLAGRCRQRAMAMPDAYEKELVNPETGWVAGWKSRDGELHDYAFIWINGPACAFGLLKPETAKNALANLEKMRRQNGPGFNHMGLPFSLIPIKPEDLANPSSSLEPTFEHFINGALAGCGTLYYLRALSIYGFRTQVENIVEEMDDGYAEGLFNGGFSDGVEFHTWDGRASGYEGTFGPSFAPLYAIAIEKGIIKPLNPEWWVE